MIFPDRAQLAAASTNPRGHLAAQGPERENLHAMRTLYHAAVDRADSAISCRAGLPVATLRLFSLGRLASGPASASASAASAGAKPPPPGRSPSAAAPGP